MGNGKRKSLNRFDRHDQWLMKLIFGIAGLLLLSITRYFFS